MLDARSAENVARLLALRELSPGARRPGRRRDGLTVFGTELCPHAAPGGKGYKQCGGPGGAGSEKVNRLLLEWVEADSMQRCSAQYCSLNPAPRSTIAAAFSPDGSTLASTHGDHTVKIICCRTGQCLRVLTGHRRTPWVVRYHPKNPSLLASGSLDHEVRLWDSETGHCIASHDFYRPIASLAFHAGGELVAVASGHKLYIWKYGRRGEEPTVVLRTRRSLRAVHFHPTGMPLLLTAEVNSLEVNDAAATSGGAVGYLTYPPPAVYFTPGLAAAAAAATTAAAELAYRKCGNLCLDQNQNQNQNPNQNQGMGWGGGVNRNDSQSTPHNQLENLNLNLTLNAAASDDKETQNSLSPNPVDVSNQTTPPPPNRLGMGEGIKEGGGESGEGRGGAVDPPQATGNPPRVENSFWMGLGRAWDGSQAPLEEEPGGGADWREVPQLGMDPGRRSPTVVCDMARPVAEPLEEEGGRGAGGGANGGTADTGVHPIGGVWWQGAGTGGGEGSMHSVGELGRGEDAARLGLRLMQAMQQQHDLGGGEHSRWEIPFLQGWVQGREQVVAQDSFNFQGTRHPSAIGMAGSGGEQGWAAGGVASGSVASVAMAAAVAAARAATLAGAGVVGATGAGLGAGLGAQIGAAVALVGNAPPGGGGLPAGMPPSPTPVAFNGLPGPAGTFPWLPRGMPGAGYSNLLEPAGAGGVTSAAELPCTVKVRLWPHDIQRPSAPLEPDTCRLTIPHAVLCSEMGAHFSPCGRFLAACVACIPPASDRGGGAWPRSNSPTHHTTAAQQLICELRVYSLEDASFGEVVASRVVRAAHCLTSIQFSPTSAHILLSYGRRHSSLLRSLVADGTSLVPLYTTIEVNVACFHPEVGGGLAYGTKEGKLRIVRHQRSAAQPIVARALEDEILYVRGVQIRHPK